MRKSEEEAGALMFPHRQADVPRLLAALARRRPSPAGREAWMARTRASFVRSTHPSLSLGPLLTMMAVILAFRSADILIDGVWHPLAGEAGGIALVSVAMGVAAIAATLVGLRFRPPRLPWDPRYCDVPMACLSVVMALSGLLLGTAVLSLPEDASDPSEIRRARDP